MNASTLRDRAAAARTGSTVSSGQSVGAAAACYLDVPVVRRGTSNDITLAVSPTTKCDDLSTQTAIRAASRFKLTFPPITSAVRGTIRGLDVPRSRQNGFD